MDEVLVDLPYLYRMRCVMPRRRSPETVIRMGTVPVRLRMVGPDEGERFRIGLPSTMDKHPSNPASGLILDGVCFVDVPDSTEGRMGRPMGDPEFFGAWNAVHRPADILPYDTFDFYPVMDAVQPGSAARSRARRVSGSAVEPARIIETDEEDAVARAVSAAACIVLHEGRLATSMLEPVVKSTPSKVGKYASRMPVADFLGEIEPTETIHAMDTVDACEGEKLVGVPEDFGGWRFPDVECAVVRVFRQLETIDIDFSWGTLREEAARMRAFEAEMVGGRVGADRLAEAIDEVEDIVRVVGRRYSGRKDLLEQSAARIERMRLMVAERGDVPAPGMSAGS
jgi:hypothetical protein